MLLSSGELGAVAAAEPALRRVRGHPGIRVIHHQRNMTTVTAAAMAGQIHHVVPVSMAVQCGVRE